MKKFISGFIAGALIFCGVPAFADSVQSIFGAKVTGVYTVQKSDGEKIADGAIINGSTYVPVRAISEVTGTPLSVDTKGKVITLGEIQAEVTSETSEIISPPNSEESTPVNWENDAKIKELQAEINRIQEIKNESAERLSSGQLSKFEAEGAQAVIDDAQQTIERFERQIEERKAKLSQQE